MERNVFNGTERILARNGTDKNGTVELQERKGTERNIFRYGTERIGTVCFLEPDRIGTFVCLERTGTDYFGTFFCSRNGPERTGTVHP